MSWSVGASGRTADVARSIAEQFASTGQAGYINDPAELNQMKAVAALLAQVLADFVGKTGVTVSATGSYSVLNGIKNYALDINVQPFWNWQE